MYVGLFQCVCLGDVGLFVEVCFDFDQCYYLFFGFGGVDQCLDDW